MRAKNRNTVWAGAFVNELVRAGVRQVCIAPGSRSAPLVTAAAEEDDLEIFVHLDERSAGFFALGIGKATGRPAVVITTSGTAAANLFPAVIEASQSESPLIVLTADRPHRLRGSDANQAIDQIRLFGGYPRAFFEMPPPVVHVQALHHLRSVAARCVAASLGRPAGPVHVNFPFEKPLEPIHVPSDIPRGFEKAFPEGAEGRAAGRPFTRVSLRRAAASEEDLTRVGTLLRGRERVLVVAGPSAEPRRTGPAAVRFARAAGYPLLADPLSGARFGAPADAAVLGTYDLFLRSPTVQDRLAPEVILRIGQTPTSGALASLLDRRPGSHQLVLDSGHRWKDHLAAANEYLQADPADFLDALSAVESGASPSSWTRAWMDAEKAAASVLERELRGELFEGIVLREVSHVVPDDGTLLVSSSMPVRDLDAFGAPRPAPMHVVGNRGASGIDGIVSTALGVAAASSSPVVAVLGDLAFYHDMNGLLAARARDLPVVFVVIHNDGGGIFHMLPIRRYEPAFTKYFATPHGLDFTHAATLYGLPFERVTDREGLRTVIAQALRAGGTHIVEVPSDREVNRRRRLQVTAQVRTAVEALPVT